MRAGGAGMTTLFDRWVRGVETPPFEDLLPPAGLRLREIPDKDDGDGAEPSAVRETADFGWKTKTDGGRLLVSEVYDGRAAYRSGVSAGDEIVALDGVKADEEHLKRVARDLPPGRTVRLHLFRLGRLVEILLVLGSRRASTYEIAPDPEAGERSKAVCRGWLGARSPGVWPRGAPGR